MRCNSSVFELTISLIEKGVVQQVNVPYLVHGYQDYKVLCYISFGFCENFAGSARHQFVVSQDRILEVSI